MSNARGQRSRTPHLDMNPMVDMAFLLVTFFLLATTFKLPEQARIVLPTSISEVDVPESNLMTITIDPNGIVYLSLSNHETRPLWFRRMASLYDMEISKSEEEAFAQLPGFGLPLSDLKPYLMLEREQQVRQVQTGVPADTARNELADWLVTARSVQPGLRFAIRADQTTAYQYIDKVIKTLTANRILRFNLVTDKRREDEGI